MLPNPQSSILSSAEHSIPGYLGPLDDPKREDDDSCKTEYGKREQWGEVNGRKSKKNSHIVFRVFPSNMFGGHGAVMGPPELSGLMQ